MRLTNTVMDLSRLRGLKVISSTLLLGACTSGLRSSQTHAELFRGVPAERVRAAAQDVIEELTDHETIVRVTKAGDVLTEGRFGVCGVHVMCNSYTRYPGSGGTPWTEVKIHIAERGENTGVVVDVDYETTGHCSGSNTALCPAEPLASTGKLEHEILQGISKSIDG